MDYLSIATFANEVMARKDPYNHHGVSVYEMCVKIASKMDDFPGDKEILYNGARLHDVGKIFFPDDFLNYSRPLTPSERDQMETHAQKGYELVFDLHYEREICNIVHFHHEHYDGSGYPFGLMGEEIPLFARIVCVADVWESITHDRAYRKALSYDAALAEMEKCRSYFDPKIYAVFLDVIKEERNDGR